MGPAWTILPIVPLLLASSRPAQWGATEVAALVGPAAQAGDDIGRSVSVSGYWAVVGAPLDDTAGQTAGAVHVFRRDPLTGWVFETTLQAGTPVPGDQFGAAVALVDDLIVVGAPYGDLSGPDTGSAYVFRHFTSGWTQVAQLMPADGASGDRYGAGVGTDGSTVLIGAPHAKEQGFVDVGAVYVWEFVNGAWVEQARLVPNSLRDKMDFGTAVDVDGDAMIIAARWMIRCYIFERTGGSSWVETAQVSAPNLAHAGGIGRTCAISGDTVVFGAPSDDLFGPGLTNAGSAYVWVRASFGKWNQEQKLKAPVPFCEDQFGRSVGIDGDFIVVGANGVDTTLGADTGAGYLFRRAGTTWIHDIQMVASSASSGDEFGRAAWLAEGLAIFGAPEEGGTGVAHVFALTPPPPTSYCAAGTSASGCSALLSSAGAASATAPSGFNVSAVGIEGSKDGLFFYGTNGGQANPWGSGTSFQCVVPPVKRAGLQTGNGTTGACDGMLSQDLNRLWCATCPKAHHNPGAGALVQLQLWYRDPLNTSNQTTSLSDALEFGVGP